MKAITKYQTLDGVEHDTQKKAESHLEKLYADHLLRITKLIISSNCKYSTVADLLDQNLHIFKFLSKLKDDMKVEVENEYE